MIVGFILAGIFSGFIAATVSLVAGFGFLGALGVYAATGFAVTAGGAAFLLGAARTRMDLPMMRA